MLKQRRLAMNRRTARLRRKKKIQHISSLQSTVEKLNTLNDNMRAENKKIMHHVTKLKSILSNRVNLLQQRIPRSNSIDNGVFPLVHQQQYRNSLLDEDGTGRLTSGRTEEFIGGPIRSCILSRTATNLTRAMERFEQRRPFNHSDQDGGSLLAQLSSVAYQQPRLCISQTMPLLFVALVRWVEQCIIHYKQEVE